MTVPMSLPSELLEDARREREQSAFEKLTADLDRQVKTGLQGITQYVEQSPLARVLAEGGLQTPTLEDLTPSWVSDALAQERQPAPTPSGTPSAMPTAPGQPNVTFEDGRQTPQPRLRPGETVGDVRISQGAAPAQTGDLRAYTRQKAVSLGIDPDIAERVAMSEGGFGDPVRQSDVTNNGRRETSFGPFQLYIGGGLGDEAVRRGHDPRDPANVYRNIDFALEHARQNGWGAFHGAARVGIGPRQGIGVAPTTPGPAHPAPVAMPERASATHQAVATAGQFTRNQGAVGNELGLPWARTIEICGPVAAAAFLRATGRLPGREEAEAMRVAQEKGYWAPGRGMGGPGTTSQLLTDLGVANRLEDSVDWNTVRADVQRGNPVIVDTQGHLFVVERYNPQDGTFDFGESANFLKAAGGRRWFRPEEIASLGMGAPRAAIYLDNPETPAPSVAAPRQQPPAQTAAAPSAQPGTMQPGSPGTITVRDPWGNVTTIRQEDYDRMPGGTADLTVLQTGPVMQRAPLDAGGPTPAGDPPAATLPAAGGDPLAQQRAMDNAPRLMGDLNRPPPPPGATFPLDPRPAPIYDWEGVERTNDLLMPEMPPLPEAPRWPQLDVHSDYMMRGPLRAMPAELDPNAEAQADTYTPPAPDVAPGMMSPNPQDISEVLPPQVTITQGGMPAGPTVGPLRTAPPIDQNEGGLRVPSRYDAADIPPPEQAPMGTPITAPRMAPSWTYDETPTVPQDFVPPPTSPYAPGQAESMEPMPGRFDQTPTYGPVEAFPGEPDQPPVPQAPTMTGRIVNTVTAPAVNRYGEVVTEAQQTNAAIRQATAARRAEDVPTSETDRQIRDMIWSATDALGMTNEALRIANSVVMATPQATADTIDLALAQVGLGRDAIGVTVLGQRFGIADVIDLPGPLGGATTMMGAGRAARMLPRGTQFGTGVAGAIERGAGAAVSAAGRGIGAGASAVGRGAAATGRVLGAGATRVGDLVEAGGHRVLDVIDDNTARVAAADARMAAQGSTSTFGALGAVPEPDPVRIPRAGYADDLSEGAETLVRRATEADAPQTTVSREEVARKAERIIGVDPDSAARWQDEALAEADDVRAVRGEVLRQAEYIDAENANRALDRLARAQERVRARGEGFPTTDAEDAELADALLEAAELMRTFERSAAASTAEGRATARALQQRRHAITARQAFATAQRARSVAEDAAVSAREVARTARTGRMTPQGEARLRALRDKLLDAERNGLAGADDGAGGKVVALEQQAVQARIAPPRRPPQAVRRGVSLGTQIASTAGQGLAGSIAGVTTGLATGQIEDAEDARNWALGGAGAALAARALLRGRGRARGALAAFGHVPTPDVPNRAVAIGADPSRRYEFRYRVANLDELVPSNLPSGAPNPAFPRDLQPRARDRVASQLQVDQIARGLEPDALLTDVGRLDSGPMIVGADNIVESGNGRTLALRRAAEQYPEQYRRYVEALRGSLRDYGLADDALEGVSAPVLVRERVTPVDRAAFAAEANNAGLLRMSSVEQAAQDAANLSDDVVTQITVGENDTIASALRRTENRDIVRQWVGTLPENERAGVIDAAGNLSAQGYERLTNALLMRTYGGQAGERIARAFIESADPTVRNVQNALMASLPDVARAEALVRSGQRAGDLSIADDVAAAVEMLARLRRDGIPVREYLDQAAMFERELTPFQEDVLRFLGGNQRRPNAIRETLKDYAARVENTADPNQADMFGGMVAPPSREDLWRGATAGTGPEAPDAPLLRATEESPPAGRAPTDGAGLADANAEPVARPAPIDIPPAPEPPAAVARRPVAPTARPGAVPEGMAPTGGPEGALAVEGAPPGPARLAPVPENVAPTGGAPGTLAQEGAPVPLARPTEAARGTLPGGGPEGRLDVEGAPSQPANLGPVGDMSTGGPEGHLTLASGRTIRDVADRISEVLANPDAPGAPDRLRDLLGDLEEISTLGARRASEMRQRLQRNGLLRAGMAQRGDDIAPLVEALGRVNPDNPEEMRAVLKIISTPRLIDRLLEYQYVNMLSSPITQAINISSNVMQIAGRLFLQNPLEFVFSGGRSTGALAAFSGAARGFREGLSEAGQIMRTGMSSEMIDDAIIAGDYGHLNRELLTEKFGPLGAAMHMISTRPLAAMDALLGHTAYASAADQYAQRAADRLLKQPRSPVAGLSREQAKQYVIANIWDFPEVIERAGKIREYTLLRSKDVEGAGWGRVERNLRQLASLRSPTEGAGFAGQATAFFANQVMPFFNVPLNFAKQGAERTVGVPVNTVRAARAYASGDVERGAELLAKATIGAGAVTTATVLAMGDNLTGDGPSDPGQRAVWEQTHRRNSWRIPGTQTWYTWEGTPFAIPFGMVAGAKEGWSETTQRAEKKGTAGTVDALGSAALKGGQGAFSGFASQSFVRALGQHYALLTGDQTGLGAVAASAAGTVSRFIPSGSMVNFLAKVGDTVERDAGKPQSVSDLPENVGARIATRIPGLRQQVDPRLDIYGEPTPNEQAGAAGFVPYYRGAGPRTGDPITERVERAGVGAITVPSDVTFRGMTIPLTVQDRRTFQEASGRAWRRIMQEAGATDESKYPPEALAQMRADARQEGVTAVLNSLGPEEIRRRVESRQPAGVR